MTIRPYLLAPVFTALLAGCVQHNTVGGDPPHPSLGAAIEVSESKLDFETLMAGEWRVLALDIHSVGAGDLYLESLTIDGGTGFTIQGDDTAHAIAPGDHTTVRIRFKPLADGETLGVLHIASNDHDDPDVAVELVGNGLAPMIELSPASWDFGEVEAGCPQQQAVVIRNIGSMELVLDEVVVSATSEELSYSWLFSEGTPLQPGESETVVVIYEPLDEMPDAGYLYVTSNDLQQPESMAVQHGVGLLAEQVIDEFDMSLHMATDILWVVDNSCSMADEQDALAANFGTFIDILDSQNMNYHLGVVTTDNSTLQGTSPIMTPSTSNLHSAFANAVMVGTMGSASEKAFQYGWGAVNSPFTDSGGPNYGFLRDQAGLRIIFVSDEAEQSAGTVDDYVANFQSLKANPDDVRLSCIVMPDYGQRFEQAANMTGGVVEYLETPNWFNTLTQLAWMSLDSSGTYALSQVPVEGTVEVQLNGVPVYAGWSLDVANNAVVFQYDYFPEDDDIVTVSYYPIGDSGGCP